MAQPDIPLSPLSFSPGIGGTIKISPDDFVVEEICADGKVLDVGVPFTREDVPGGKLIHFVLQKQNWTSSSALSELALRLHLSQKNFNVAGTKDKTAISVQTVSVSGATKEQLLSLKIKDISVNGAWVAADRLRLGDLLGNRFTIQVRNSEPGFDHPERIRTIYSELNGTVPNYFGEQRFGSGRRNTHVIGEKLLRGDCEGAALSFLCDSAGKESNPQIVAARNALRETSDYEQALINYPKHLRLERTMVAFLAKNPHKFTEAFKRLPRNILLLFVHAFQSHLFNILLSERVAEAKKDYGNGAARNLELQEGEYYCGERMGFPDISKHESEGWVVAKLIGSSSPLNDRERALLDDFGINKEAFRMKILPEVAAKGSYRPIIVPLRDFTTAQNAGGVMCFKFSLPSGSYATVAMREFMEVKK